MGYLRVWGCSGLGFGAVRVLGLRVGIGVSSQLALNLPAGRWRPVHRLLRSLRRPRRRATVSGRGGSEMGEIRASGGVPYFGVFYNKDPTI